MDEHRIGLKPILRRMWGRRGERLVAKILPGYEWLYIYAFACPETGESRFWICSHLTKEMYSDVICHFRKSIDQEIHVILVEDGSSTHSQESDEETPGLQIVKLPPYSPELQPAERLWQLTDAQIANQCLTSIQQVKKLLLNQCGWLESQHDLIRRYTLFHWWPLSRQAKVQLNL